MDKAALFILLYFNIQLFIYSQPNAIYSYTNSIDLIKLPGQIKESSGLISFKDLLWTFNDSGGRSILYGLSPDNGFIKQKIKLKKCHNIDWEDIAQDSSYIYVGDFGNNFGIRRQLKIYKIDKATITTQNKIRVIPEVICFKYREQTEYKFSKSSTPFDCEAIISFGDSLALFTKDWSNYTTSLYMLPKIPGQYIIEKKITINSEGLVTGADYSDKLIMCGRNSLSPYIILFNQDFSVNKIILLPLLSGYQIEAISCQNNTIYIASEQTGYPQCMFKIPVKDIF